MITTTLNNIFACETIRDEYKREFLEWTGKTQPDEEPIPFASIVQNLGLSEALFFTRAEPQHANVWMQFGLFCARRIERLIEQRSIDAITVGENYINGDATENDLEAALNVAIQVGREYHDIFSSGDIDKPNLDLMRLKSSQAAAFALQKRPDKAAAAAAEAVAENETFKALQGGWIEEEERWRAYEPALENEEEAQKAEFLRLVS